MQFIIDSVRCNLHMT